MVSIAYQVIEITDSSPTRAISGSPSEIVMELVRIGYISEAQYLADLKIDENSNFGSRPFLKLPSAVGEVGVMYLQQLYG